MFIRKHLTVFIVILTLFSLCACSAKTEEVLPEIVIGYSNYRPYCYTDENGDLAGIDVDFAREACRRIGYEPVFKLAAWRNRDFLLNSGAIDLFWCCVPMESESDSSVLVGPYMYSRQVVAVLKNSSIQTLDDLAGKKIAVRVSSTAEQIFLHQTDIYVPELEDVYCLDDAETVVTALRNDYVDACAGHLSLLIEALETSGTEYRLLDSDLSRTALGVAFPSDSDPALREKLSTALNEMRADGTCERILTEYGVDAEMALKEVLE